MIVLLFKQVGIFRVNLGSVINIFTVLGLIFVSRLSFQRGDNFLS